MPAPTFRAFVTEEARIYKLMEDTRYDLPVISVRSAKASQLSTIVESKNAKGELLNDSELNQALKDFLNTEIEKDPKIVSLKNVVELADQYFQITQGQAIATTTEEKLDDLHGTYHVQFQYVEERGSLIKMMRELVNERKANDVALAKQLAVEAERNANRVAQTLALDNANTHAVATLSETEKRHKEALDALRTERDLQLEQIELAETSNANLITKIAGLSLSLENISKKLTGTQAQLTAANSSLQERTSELKMATIRNDSLGKDLFSLQEDIAKTGEALTQAKNQLRSKTAENEKLAERIDMLTEEKQDQAVYLDEATQRIEELSIEIDAMSRRDQMNESDFEDLAEKNKALETANSDLTSQIAALENQLTQQTSQFNSLRGTLKSTTAQNRELRTSLNNLSAKNDQHRMFKTAETHQRNQQQRMLQEAQQKQHQSSTSKRSNN